MALPNENIETKDLIRPLSPEAIAYFFGDDLGFKGSTYEMRMAKFVRLGSVMMVGLAVYHGKVDALSGEQRTLLHVDLAGALMLDRELYESVSDEEFVAEPLLRGAVDLHDAGYVSISPLQGSSVFTLSGKSYDFGRADEAGRKHTVEVAQTLMGGSARVVSNE